MQKLSEEEREAMRKKRKRKIKKATGKWIDCSKYLPPQCSQYFVKYVIFDDTGFGTIQFGCARFNPGFDGGTLDGGHWEVFDPDKKMMLVVSGRPHPKKSKCTVIAWMPIPIESKPSFETNANCAVQSRESDCEYILERLRDFSFTGILAKGYISERDLRMKLSRKRFPSIKEFRACINDLADMGYIEISCPNKGQAGRPSRRITFLSV